MPGAEAPIGGLDVLSALGPFARGQFVAKNWDALKGLAQGQVELQQRQQEAQRAAYAQVASQAAAQKQSWDEYSADPTNPQKEERFFALNPKYFETVKANHDLKRDDQQRQDLRDMSALNGMLGASDWDGAAAAIQRRIDADTKAGQDAADDKHVLDLIKAKNPQALALVKAQLYGALGPDKYTAAFSAQNKADIDAAKLPGEIANQRADVDLKSAQTLDERAKAASEGTKVVGADQSLVQVGQGGQGGGGYGGFVDKLIGTENSTGDPSAKNPRSSATGDGQFINSTWLRLVKANHPDWAQGKTDGQILAMRADQAKSRQMVADYADENSGVLQAAGIPVNAATLAGAHKLGPDGFKAVFQAQPGDPMIKVVGADVVKANPQFAKQTAGQYANGLIQKFGTDPVGQPSGVKVLFQGGNVAATAAMNDAAASNLTGDAYLSTLPNTMQAQVKALAEGRQAFPTGAGMKSQYWQQRLAAVAQYDPNFDAVNYGARAATRKDFTSGKSAQNIKSLNTAIGHMGELDRSIDGLGNTGWPLNNSIAHGIARATGSDARLAKFEAAKIAVANELTQVFRGAGGAEADVQGWLKQLNGASSPATLHETVKTMVDLLNSRVEAIGDSYNQGMGTTDSPLKLLNPKAAETLQRLEGKTQVFSMGGQKVTVVERK